jgi:hypothetical protein
MVQASKYRHKSSKQLKFQPSNYRCMQISRHISIGIWIDSGQSRVKYSKN